MKLVLSFIFVAAAVADTVADAEAEAIADFIDNLDWNLPCNPANSDWSCCDHRLCGPGEGDCDWDSQCQKGSLCGVDNGSDYGGDYLMDVCVQEPDYATFADGYYAGCECADGSVSPGSHQWAFRPTWGEHVGCVGGCGGNHFNLEFADSSVKNIQIWQDSGSTSGGFQAMLIRWYNDEERLVGTKPAGKPALDEDIYLGEVLHGDFVIGTNGMTTDRVQYENSDSALKWLLRVGYIKFELKQLNDGTPRTIELGDSGNMQYSVDATDSLLAGFYGRAAGEIDQLGAYFVKPVKSIAVTGIQYPSLSSYMANLNPSTLAQYNICNSNSADGTMLHTSFFRHVGTSRTFSFEASMSFEVTESITFEGGVPFVEKATATTSATWSVSATASMSQTVDTYTEQSASKDVPINPNTYGTVTITQYNSVCNVKWIGSEEITFKDDTKMTLAVGGIYEGVYVSSEELTIDLKPCPSTGCTCIPDGTGLGATGPGAVAGMVHIGAKGRRLASRLLASSLDEPLSG